MLASTSLSAQWTQINNGLGSTSVTSMFAFADTIIVGTDGGGIFKTINEGGYYISLNSGDSWINGITGERTNLVGLSSPKAGGFYYVLGQNGYQSANLSSWDPINLNGVTGGDITAVAFSGANMFVGTQTGGVFRQNLAALPVELVSFTAIYENAQVELRWTTVSESKNYGFEIQRKIARSWEQIGFVAGQGTISEPHSYHFIDDLKDVKLVDSEVSYRLKQMDLDGSFEYSGEIAVALKQPDRFVLAQNYPNPFNPTTTINFVVPEAGYITLTVYNQAGQHIKTLFGRYMQPGHHRVSWDATDEDGHPVASGVYLYKLEAAGFAAARKLTLMR